MKVGLLKQNRFILLFFNLWLISNFSLSNCPDSSLHMSLEEVKLFIETGGQIECLDAGILELAIMHSERDIAKLLIHNNVGYEIFNKETGSSLFSTSFNPRDLWAVKEFMINGYTPNQKELEYALIESIKDSISLEFFLKKYEIDLDKKFEIKQEVEIIDPPKTVYFIDSLYPVDMVLRSYHKNVIPSLKLLSSYNVKIDNHTNQFNKYVSNSFITTNKKILYKTFTENTLTKYF